MLLALFYFPTDPSVTDWQPTSYNRPSNIFPYHTRVHYIPTVGCGGKKKPHKKIGSCMVKPEQAASAPVTRTTLTTGAVSADSRQ